MLFKKLNLPDNVSSAQFDTRLNGRILSPKTRGKYSGTGVFLCGIDVVVESADEVRIETFTVENSTHTWNFSAIVTPKGKLVGGSVNCFTFGPQAMDQEYLDLFLEETSAQKWDEIVLKK